MNNISTKIKISKNLAIIGLVACAVIAPGATAHAAAVIIHTGYEIIAYTLEEILHHTFGMDKFQCQLLVFYTTLAVLAFAVYRLWRILPKLLNKCRERLAHSKSQIIAKWRNHALGHRYN